MTYGTDMRVALAGEYRVVDYVNRPSILAAPSWSGGDLIMDRQGDTNTGGVSLKRAQAGFEAAWRDPATLTEPEQVVGHLWALIGEIRGLAPRLD